MISPEAAQEQHGTASLRKKSEFLHKEYELEVMEAKQLMEAVKNDKEKSSDEQRRAERQAQIAEKRLELFEAEHDVTGAMKGERLGQDLADILNAEEAFRMDENGAFEISREAEQTQMLLVNMGELDRLNASGDHGPGDAGLAMTFDKIEQTIRAQLRQSNPDLTDEAKIGLQYSIYRYSGNDFAVVLKGADQTLVDTLRAELTSVREIQEAFPDQDPVPLSVDAVALSEVYQVLNRLREHPAEREVFDAEPKKAKMAIDVMKDLVQTQNDISKLQTRMERMVAKIKEARSGGDEAKAAEFYAKFQQKALEAMFQDPKLPGPVSFERLVGELEGLRAFDDPPSAAWRHALEEKPLEAALSQMKSRRSAEGTADEAIQDVVLERLKTRLSPSKTETAEGAAGRDAENAFEPPRPTRGKEKLRALQAEYETALDKNREKPDDLDAYQEAELAFLDLEIAAAWRDELTGLERRGPMFGKMEKAFESGKSVSTLFIDMAFLKYFNNVGGREVGDTAIQKAAEILDAVASEFQAEGVEAYRFGGDEFALSITGGDEALVDKVKLRIRELQTASGRVPPTADSHPNYTAEGLVFNIGSSHAKSGESFKKELQDLGLELKKAGTPNEANELAEYAVKFADKEVEIYKAVDRLDRLVDLLVREGEVAHFSEIEKYSQKAIFGSEGSKKIRVWAKLRRGEGAPYTAAVEQQIQREIREFTLESIDKKNAEKKGYETSVDRLIEDQIRLEYFRKREGELEQVIGQLSARITEKDAKIEELNAALQIAHAERDTVSELKQKIMGAAPAKTFEKAA